MMAGVSPELARFIRAKNGWGGFARPEQPERPKTGRLVWVIPGGKEKEVAAGPWGLLQSKKKDLEARGYYKKGSLKLRY